MGVGKFMIVLDSPTGSYYAGTNVTGRVLFTLDKPKKFRGLKIKFEGKAHVAWTGQESVRKNDGDTTTETVSYSATEEYFSNKYYLTGSASGEVEIPAGEHAYPFNTVLPPQLPTSFEGEYGYVRYSIVATLDRPWKVDLEAKSLFQVVTPLDLNYHTLAKQPVKKEESKTFCCFCCKSGPLTLVVCIPHTGYVPGQEIPLTIEVDNASNEAVESIKVKVLKILKWTARNPKHDTKYDKIDLATLSLEGVEESGSKSVTQNIIIPPMPFVNLDACSIIDVNFILKVKACVSGMCSKDLSAEIPLIIGTVPISNGPSGGFAPSPMAMPGSTDISPAPPPPYGMPGVQPVPQIGGYEQPGFPAPPPPGLNTGGIPMADGTSPYSQNGYSAPPVMPPQPDASLPGSYGQPAPYGAANQPMYPQPVYPDLTIDKLPTTGLLGFNVTPSAPPADAESAPLMNKP